MCATSRCITDAPSALRRSPVDSFDDKVDGKTDKAGGKIKEMAGETFNDPDLAAEGRLDQAKDRKSVV